MATPPSNDDDHARRSPTHDGGSLRVDPARFDAVYRETAGPTLRALRRLLPSEAVDDAFQDTFLVVARRLDEFEGRSKLSTWVYGIAVRVAKDHRRTRARGLRKHGALEAEPPPELAPSPERELERVRGARALHGILDAMDDDQREVFVLVDLEGLSVPEVATLLDLNTNTAYGRLRAARQAFDASVRRLHARER